MNKQAYWLGLHLAEGIGSIRAQNLLAHFNGIEDLWHASENALQSAGLSPELALRFSAFRRTIHFEQEFEKIARAKARLITCEDEEYPPHLLKVSDYPIVLYVKGEFASYDQLALTMVGTRKASSYGQDCAFRIARDVAKHNVTIISGLAQGIDTAAHRGALAARGRTIAVLGCGIDRIYPAQNATLANDILENGAIVSEFAIGTPPHAHNFPRRNRIMSGMGLGVLVVEAPIASGALLTADSALAQGRDVFAVPSSIFSVTGTGTNRLIQEGAKLITGAEDILNELKITQQHYETKHQVETLLPMTDDERSVFTLLGAEPLHIDEIIRLCGLPAHIVTGVITLLELKGLAQSTGNMHYCRSRSI